MTSHQTSGYNRSENEKTNGYTHAHGQQGSSDHDSSHLSGSDRVGEAVDQVKKASSSVCDAASAIGNASADAAKQKLHDGKEKALELEQLAEHKIAERPLLYVGAAFALGWLLSRIAK